MARAKGTVTVTFSFDGKRYYVTGKTKKEAEQKAALKKRDLEDGTIRYDNKTLVRDWVAECYDKYTGHQAPKTRSVSRNYANKWIVETIGDMPIGKVRNKDIQGVLNSMEGYSNYTMTRVQQLFHWVFEKAVENEMINRNPCIGTRKLKGTKTKRRAITDEEREQLIKAADEMPKFNYFLIMLYCGCRPSEARELQGRDIEYIKGKPVLHIRGTKTANADRHVPIPQVMMDRLPSVGDYEYIFTTEKGTKLNAQSHQRFWKQCSRIMNINMGCRTDADGHPVEPFPLADDFTPYCLRHTFCTDLAKASVDMRTAQKLMGHSTIQMTADIYTHVDKSMILDTADIMNAYYAINRSNNPDSIIRRVI